LPCGPVVEALSRCAPRTVGTRRTGRRWQNWPRGPTVRRSS